MTKIRIVKEKGNFNAFAAKKTLVASVSVSAASKVTEEELTSIFKSVHKNINAAYEVGNRKNINAGWYITNVEPQVKGGLPSLTYLDFVPVADGAAVAEKALYENRTAQVLKKLGA